MQWYISFWRKGGFIYTQAFWNAMLFCGCCVAEEKFLRRSLATHYYMVILVTGTIEVSLRWSQMRSYDMFSFHSIASNVGGILVKLLNLHYLKARHSYRKGKSWYTPVFIWLGCLNSSNIWEACGALEGWDHRVNRADFICIFLLSLARRWHLL